MKKEILLSGIKPTGNPHIGNYFGALKQWVDLQNKYKKVYIFIPDYHALISVQDKKKMEKNILNVAIDLLAVGIDPKKVVFYKQSDIPAHTELTWIFNCIVSVPTLMRAHAFKDSQAKNKDVSVGLFDYPILQTSDIVLYDAEIVPVGEDQKQHIEMAREIVRKFNNTFGKTFKEPRAFVKKEVSVILGNDGRKMSKSYKNELPLFVSEKETLKYMMSIPMDSKKISAKKNPEKYTLYKIFKLFANAEENKKMRKMFEEGGYGYGEIKIFAAEVVNKYLKDMRKKRKELEKNPEKVLKILKKGGAEAKKQANKKILEVRKKIGFEIY